jgi:hypothetical protein
MGLIWLVSKLAIGHEDQLSRLEIQSQLSLGAEEITESREAPQILRMNIARSRRMLTAGIDDAQHQTLVEDMLRDAEEMLGEIIWKR